jgi:uncharacterized protein YqjF (DUF2071 family)
MTQTWEKLLFAHWPISPELLRPHIPPELDIDTFDHQSWIAVVPFRISGFTARGIPVIPYLSCCNELNVRTYVSFQGRPGVFFFSLDTDSLLSVLGARAWFRLPYYYCKMNSELLDDRSIRYRSARYQPGQRRASFYGSYRPTSLDQRPAGQGLESWLVERYTLFTRIGRAIYSGDIHHLPWRLQSAELKIEENSMTEPLSILLPAQAPHLLYSESIKVLLWPPKQISG